jgi:DNA-binding response OmpR family regulator
MYIEIIDDNKELTRHLKKSFIKKWYGAQVYNSREEFLKLSDFTADIFLMDINLWDWNWLDLIEHLRLTRKINAPVIVMSGQTKTGTKTDSFVIWADDFLEKPFTFNDIEERINDIQLHITSRTKIECGCHEKPLFSCLSGKEKLKMFKRKDS